MVFNYTCEQCQSCTMIIYNTIMIDIILTYSNYMSGDILRFFYSRGSAHPVTKSPLHLPFHCSTLKKTVIFYDIWYIYKIWRQGIIIHQWLKIIKCILLFLSLFISSFIFERCFLVVFSMKTKRDGIDDSSFPWFQLITFSVLLYFYWRKIVSFVSCYFLISFVCTFL